MCSETGITEVDQQLGRLLAELEHHADAENTVVIVTADHGKYVGAHGLEAHNFGGCLLPSSPQPIGSPQRKGGLESAIHTPMPGSFGIPGVRPYIYARDHETE